jgi:hypothetical protein
MDPLSTNTLTDRKPSAQQDYGVATGTRPPSAMESVFLTRKWISATLAFVAFHLHLLEDLVGSRGPDGFIWPIPYLFPFSNRWIGAWGGQSKLDAWPNIALTIVLLCVTVWIAVKPGVSPVDIFAPTADRSWLLPYENDFRQPTDGLGYRNCWL